MSTAGAVDERTDVTSDLDVDFEAEIPCCWTGRAEHVMFFIHTGSGLEDSAVAGECSGHGVEWIRIAGCCGRRYLFCSNHHTRWVELSKWVGGDELLHGLTPKDGCMRARRASDDKWVRI